MSGAAVIAQVAIIGTEQVGWAALYTLAVIGCITVAFAGLLAGLLGLLWLETRRRDRDRSLDSILGRPASRKRGRRG